MTYVIRYSTASHDAVDGDFETLDAALEAYANRLEWYRDRGGAIVEGTVEFPDDARFAEFVAGDEQAAEFVSR